MTPASPARLLWRCRRGMKELDLLLERYAREHYEGAPPARQRAFERLLELPDPVLVELLLLGGAPPEAAVASAGSDSPEAAPGSCGEPCSIGGAAAVDDPELAQVAALVAAPGRR